MRPGPPRGTTASLAVQVTSDMGASRTTRAGRMIYGTRPLIAHMVEACELILQEHFEDGEEAIDIAVEIRHREPVPIGSKVTHEATVAAVEPTRVTFEIMVRCWGRTVARGTVEKQIVRSEEFRADLNGKAAQR